jgi:hypothetical protein
MGGKRLPKNDAHVVIGAWWRRREIRSAKARGDHLRPRRIVGIERDGLRVMVVFEDYRRPIAVSSLLAQYEPCDPPLAAVRPEPEPPPNRALDDLIARLMPEIRKAIREGIDAAFSAGEK